MSHALSDVVSKGPFIKYENTYTVIVVRRVKCTGAYRGGGVKFYKLYHSKIEVYYSLKFGLRLLVKLIKIRSK